MSDVSSASQTISTTLSKANIDSMVDCTALKFILTLIMVVLFICVFMSFMQSSCCENRESCQRIENFSPQTFDNFFSYTKYNSSSYQIAELTAPDNELNAPSNLLFGKAMRIITDDGVIHFELLANLYVLGGNPHSVGPMPQQSYKVYLKDPKTDNTPTFAGELTLDGDGIYKLKLNGKSDFVYKNDIQVVYVKDGEEQILLKGSFS